MLGLKFVDPDAENVFRALRKAGVKTVVVSNFDTRLRPLLQVLKCDHWFDAVAVSAEVCLHVLSFLLLMLKTDGFVAEILYLQFQVIMFVLYTITYCYCNLVM